MDKQSSKWLQRCPVAVDIYLGVIAARRRSFLRLQVSTATDGLAGVPLGVRVRLVVCKM